LTPSHPSPLAFALRILAAGLAVLASLGLSCDRNREPPSLPSPILREINLRIADPEQGLAEASLDWSDPGGQATFFEVYQSLSLDSLARGLSGPPVAKTDSPAAVLRLPTDRNRPFTVYYAVRAVHVEATGQKLTSDTLLPDSLTVSPSLSIIAPGAGTYLAGRVLDVRVQSQSDPGVTLRLAYFEKDSNGWVQKADTCLPMNACGVPVFGHAVEEESLVLAQREANDTVPALFCVIGTESFQSQRTGLAQSLSCARFFRTGP
jgi:hypothetical protein